MKNLNIFAKITLIIMILSLALSPVITQAGDAAAADPVQEDNAAYITRADNTATTAAAQDSNTTDTLQRKTVRVGYFIGEGFQEVSPVDGRRSGYCYEYLQTLSYYTGWQYEYIETSWAGALEKIANGDIDILAQVSKTEEREEFMLYADRPMGAEEYYLYVLPDKNKTLRSDDITTLNGAKVGVNAGSYQLMTFIDWCKENNIQCEIVESEDEDYRTECFYNGELDAIVDNDFYLDQEWSPLYKTGTSDYYMCVTTSRPDILEELNAAQERLFDDSPLYIHKLQSTYFPHDTVPKALDKYETETEWLETRMKTKGKIILGYMDDYLPYCNLNKETKQPEGAITVFTDSLKENFDIEVECIPYDGLDALYDAVIKNKIDACFPMYDMLWKSEELGIMQTDAFIEFPMAYIFRKNEYSEQDSSKVYAVARVRPMQSAYIRDKHPDAKILVYNDYDDCMTAISKGEVDGTYINSFILSRYFDLYQEYSNLDIVYMTKNASLCLGVNISACPSLLTIFNKNIMLIDDAVKTSYLVRNTEPEQKYMLTKFLKKNALSIVISILVISMVIISLFWFQLRRVRLAQQHEKEAREAANEAYESANRANNSKIQKPNSFLT